MSRFRLTIDNEGIASQIADLINSGKQIWYYLTSYSILVSPIEFLIELDRDKVIGVIGLEQKTDKVTELKYLCVHPDYRQQGIGRNMLELGIKAAKTEYVYGAVRSDNHVNIRNNFRVGMRPVGKHRGRGCHIIIFARRRGNVEYQIYQRRP